MGKGVDIMDTTRIKTHLDRIGWAENVPPGVFDAIKELIDVVETQQSEIAALKAQVERLESRAGPVVADGTNRGRSKLFKT